MKYLPMLLFDIQGAEAFHTRIAFFDHLVDAVNAVRNVNFGGRPFLILDYVWIRNILHWTFFISLSMLLACIRSDMSSKFVAMLL